ncbi:MAG: hypothetical protein NVSMB54_11430 [Ktedonobacteraceae bacterium]
MSGSGSGSAGGSGGGVFSIGIGGISVEIPATDGTPYAQEIQDLSLCAAIMQMASVISNSTVSAAIHSAAAKALGIESTQLAQETNSPSASSAH